MVSYQKWSTDESEGDRSTEVHAVSEMMKFFISDGSDLVHE